MKRFLLTICYVIGLPVMLLLVCFIWTDPFRILSPFDINNVDATNREYLSTELFLENKDTIDYNSFVFSSSRGGGINTYQWKQYLEDDACPFLFQAWSESLTGIELKIDYLVRNKVPIKNALILIDIPGTFAAEQLPHKALSMKHYMFTGMSKFEYCAIQFYNFCQKPSLWLQSVRRKTSGVKEMCATDIITNDWDNTNKYNFATLPLQDSLKSCSRISRQSFLAEISAKSDKDITESPQLINSAFYSQLQHIKSMLDACHTDYHIIITPAIAYTNPYINSQDLSMLQYIFGPSRIHDYSRDLSITADCNNFSDPNHFGSRIGYLIIEDIYCGNAPVCGMSSD